MLLLFKEVQEVITTWESLANNLEIPKKVVKAIKNEFVILIPKE